MIRRLVLSILAVVAFGAPLAGQDARMSFFVTSHGPGDGANLGGLAGADQFCSDLARAAGSIAPVWRAYLSTTATSSTPQINARDRIGTGPWFNHAGVEIAQNLNQLHGENHLTKATMLTEKGDTVNGRGDQPNMHDTLTGSDLMGRAVTGEEDTTCGNWTGNTETGGAMVGHHDRQGGGQNPTSWNSAHRSRGCGQSNLQATGGNGLFYCFRAP